MRSAQVWFGSASAQKKGPGHEAPASRTGRLYVWET